MMSLKLDPSKTALVVIGLQNATVSRPNLAPHSGADVVERSRKLAKRCARRAEPSFTCTFW